MPAPTPPLAAQITICGVLNRDTLAALVDLAMTAGAALLLQPRALAPDVVEAVPARRVPLRLPAARRKGRCVTRQAKPATAAAAPSPVALTHEIRAQRALRHGPLLVREFCEATGLNKRQALALVETGAIVASGVTRGRRYALPGPSAKEAP